MLYVKNLTKHFPSVKAVDKLNFELKKGRVCGFVGPNGAGKTTAMRIIATLDNPSYGDIYINGKNIRTHPYETRRILGFMPDHFVCYPHLTVSDTLQFYARAYGVDGKIRDKRIEQIMNFTGLDKIKNKKASTLSKGMQQRLNLGRMLSNDPELLVLDEPAAGLDPRARVELRYLIKQLAEQGKTIFVSSHILMELSEICDDILIIDHGAMVLFGDLNSIQRKMQRTLKISITLQNEEKIPALERFLSERENIMDIHIEKNNVLIFTLREDSSGIPKIMREILESGFPVIEFKPRLMSMEDIFIQITEGEFS